MGSICYVILYVVEYLSKYMGSLYMNSEGCYVEIGVTDLFNVFSSILKDTS